MWRSLGSRIPEHSRAAIQGIYPRITQRSVVTWPLEKTLPTFDWLAQGDITPTTSKTFTLQELTSALQRASVGAIPFFRGIILTCGSCNAVNQGFIPALSCSGSTLNEAWWYFNLR